MDNQTEQAIKELIGLTKTIVEFTGEVDEAFIELLEDRNKRFESLQNQLAASSPAVSNTEQVGFSKEVESNISDKDVILDTIDAEKNKQLQLQELYQLTRQAEIVVQKLKHEAAENIKKIQKGKQTTDLYDHGRGGRTSAKRNPYQGSTDGVFFDKKK